MIETEKGIIGAVLIDKTCLKDVHDKLKPCMFENDLCSETFGEMLTMYELGEEINPLSVSVKLEGTKYDRETISTFLKECLLGCTTSTVMKPYSDILIKDYKSREVKNLFQRVSLDARDIDSSIAEIMTSLDSLKTNETKNSKSLKDIVTEYKDNYFKDLKKQLVKTGFYKLDDCLGGLEGGDICVVGARPSVGKSAIVTQIIGEVAKEGKKVGYFNLEMNENQVYERFVSRFGKLGLTRIRRAKAFLNDEQEKFEQANKELLNLDVIISTGGKTISQIRSECRYRKFDLIVIDYLQLIKADKHYSNRASEVGDISKSIKALAMELNVPIILLSQLNRTSEQRETKEPTMSELRESGDIEQDASQIVLLWNVSDEYKAYKGLVVCKNRQGELIKEGLKFNGDNMEFTEYYGDFYHFEQTVRNMEKNHGTSFEENEDCPFS